MEESISLTSLASEFVAADTNNKRGKKNAIERDVEEDDEDTLEISAFEPFDMNKQIYAQ